MIRQAKEGGVIQVAAEQYSSPTSAKVLADFVMKMIDANEYGIYHASCEGCCSRVEAAEEILRCMGRIRQAELRKYLPKQARTAREGQIFRI